MRLVILLGAIATAILFLLFPGTSLLDGLKNKPADSASVHYMQAILANQPKNDSLRIDLSKKLLEIWSLDEAKQVLKPISGNSSHSMDARLLKTEINFRQFFNDTKVQHKLTEKMQIQDDINKLYPEIRDIKKLETLATWSTELGNPLIAAKIYQRILKILDALPQANKQSSTTIKKIWLVLGIQEANAEGVERTAEYFAIKNLQALLAAKDGQQAMRWAKHYVKRFKDSSALLQLAIEIAGFEGDIAQARDWGRLYIKHFSQQETDLEKQFSLELAANNSESSLQWVQSLMQKKPISPSILQFASSLATKQGDRSPLASNLGRELLTQLPNDPALLEKQVQLELAVPNLKAAMTYAQQWVRQQPNNIQARLQLAKTSLWSGKPKESMKQWSWLYDKTGNPAYFKEAVKIGRTRFQYKHLALLYNKLSHTRKLSEIELEDWYASLQGAGYIDAGESLLNGYVNRWKNHRQAWQMLANTQALLGQLETAIETQKKIDSAFNVTLESRVKQIKYFFQLGQIDSAWDLLTLTEQFATDEDPKFWILYGELAWITGNEAAAIKSYRQLHKTGSLKKDMVPRLIRLAKENENQENQTQLLLSFWEQSKEPVHILKALDILLDLGKREESQRLIKQAERQIDKFEQLPQYWIIKARLAENSKSDAQQFLEYALRLSPESKEIMISLLWHILDSGDTDNLKPLLQSISKYSRLDTEVWQAMAAGYRSLGEPLQAIKWYAKSAKQNPNNYLLLLSYADTLEEAGQKVAASKLRQNLFHHVRPEILAQMKKSEGINSQEFQHRYTQLITRYIGMNAGEEWLTWLQQKSDITQNTVFDEYRIAWYLSQGRTEQARWWLLKQQYNRLKIPAWRKLAFTLADNNIAETGKILNGSAELYTLDRIAGLQSVGREFEALALARENLNTASDEDQLLAYRKTASGLSLNNPNGFALAGKFDNISDLGILGFFAETASTINNDNFWLKLNYNHLTTKENTVNIRSDQDNEKNIRIKWRHRNPRHQYWLEGLASLRDDQDLFGFKAGYQYQLWNGWSTKINLQFNELSNESAAFRLGGAKDQLTLALNGELSKREYLSLSLHGRHYKSRSGTSLGIAIGAEFQGGYKVRFANPSITVVLHGSLNQSKLNKTLPKELVSIVGSDTSIENVLSKQYQEIGLDLRVAEGNIKPFGFVDRNIRYFVDTGVFFSDSSSGPGVKVEAGIGSRLFGNDELSLTGRYVDVQGGVNTLPTKSLQLRYSHRFN